MGYTFPPQKGALRWMTRRLCDGTNIPTSHRSFLGIVPARFDKTGIWMKTGRVRVTKCRHRRRIFFQRQCDCTKKFFRFISYAGCHFLRRFRWLSPQEVWDTECLKLPTRRFDQRRVSQGNHASRNRAARGALRHLLNFPCSQSGLARATTQYCALLTRASGSRPRRSVR